MNTNIINTCTIILQKFFVMLQAQVKSFLLAKRFLEPVNKMEARLKCIGNNDEKQTREL